MTIARGRDARLDASPAAADDPAREIRSSDRHRHLPLHRRRGIDAVAARSSAPRTTRRRSPSTGASSARRAQREGGVEVDTQGDAFFFAFPIRSGGSRRGRGDHGGARRRARSSLRIGLHTGTPARHRRGLRRRRRALCRAGCSDLGMAARSCSRSDRAAHRATCSSPISASTDSRTSRRRCRSTSSARAPSLRSRRSRTRTCRAQRARSSAASESRRRWSRAPEPERRSAHAHRARRHRQDAPRSRGRREASCPSYKAGVFWVGLAALRDPSLVTETIAQTLGARDGLAEHIAEREMLLLLDNLEQVDRGCASSSLRSSAACPNLALLVTAASSCACRAKSSTPSLRLPSPEAVSLFCERSQLEPTARSPSFARASTPSRSRSSSPPPAPKPLARAEILERLASTPRPVERRQGRRCPAGDAARDHRVELRPAKRGGATALRPPVCLPRRVHARGRRRSHRRPISTACSPS